MLKPKLYDGIEAIPRPTAEQFAMPRPQRSSSRESVADLRSALERHGVDEEQYEELHVQIAEHYLEPSGYTLDGVRAAGPRDPRAWKAGQPVVALLASYDTALLTGYEDLFPTFWEVA